MVDEVQEFVMKTPITFHESIFFTLDQYCVFYDYAMHCDGKF